MSMTQTEKIGFGKNVLELVKREAAVLKKAGFDADEIHAILHAKYAKASGLNARQEEAKRGLKELTNEVVAATDDLYRTASGYLDAAIAAAGKGSDAAANFQRLRSRVRMPDADEPEVEPVPDATV